MRVATFPPDGRFMTPSPSDTQHRVGSVGQRVGDRQANDRLGGEPAPGVSCTSLAHRWLRLRRILSRRAQLLRGCGHDVLGCDVVADAAPGHAELQVGQGTLGQLPDSTAAGEDEPVAVGAQASMGVVHSARTRPPGRSAYRSVVLKLAGLPPIRRAGTSSGVKVPRVSA